MSYIPRYLYERLLLGVVICLASGPVEANVGGVYVTASPLLPCFAGLDECTGDYRLPIGLGYGRFGNSRSALADAIYDGDCAIYTDVGDLTASDYLVIYINDAYAISTSRSDGGLVIFEVDVWEYTDDACYGAVNRNFSADVAECSVAHLGAGASWQALWAETSGDCGSSYGDPGDCHMPDIGISYPGSTGRYCYLYGIGISVCDDDGTNCVNDVNVGAFVVDWTS